MKILLAACAAACLAAVAPSGVAAPTQVNPQYRQCVGERIMYCYPRDGNGAIYRPDPESPEGIAFQQCAAIVREDCAILYPG